MASYQQAPAYQTYQTTPYQLPVQQITQALATRQSYWDGAAASLKNAYQNYLGLDLSREDNHQKLNALMQVANQNLKKATQSDLSIGENYGKALGIFDPITNDDNIMGDHAITSWYKGQMQEAQDFRTKNGGKEYSETNVRYMMKGLEDFTKDPSASNWRDHYSTRRAYTPFYDYSPEMSKLYKDWKPSAMSSTMPDVVTDEKGKPININGATVQNGYLKTITDKSTSAAQYRAYLDANLSEKAKGQLAIEGRVRYGDNLQALAQDFGRHNVDQIQGYSDYVKQLEGEKLNAKGTDVEAYDHAINEYKGRINDLKTTNAKLTAGDYSYLKDNKDAIAGQIYTENFINHAADASQRKDITVKYSSDQTYLNMYDQNQQNQRLERSIQARAKESEADRQVRLYGLQLKYNGLLNKTGELPGLAEPTYDKADLSNNSTFGEDILNKDIEASKTEFDDAGNALKNRINSSLKIDLDSMDEITREAAKNGWIAKNPNDPFYQKFVAAADKRKIDLESFKAVNESVDQQIAKRNPELTNARKTILGNINKGETIVVTESGDKSDVTGFRGLFSSPKSLSINLSPNQIRNILNGTEPGIQLKNVEIATTPAGYTGTKPVLVINGKQYDIPESSVLNIARNDINKSAGDYAAKRRELLNQEVTNVQGVRRIYGDEVKTPWIAAAKNIVVDAIAGTTSGVVKPTEVRLTARSNDGGIFFTIDGDAKVNAKEVENKVKDLGGLKSGDRYYLPGKTFGNVTAPKIYNDPRLENLEKMVYWKSTGKKSDSFDTPDIRFGTRNFSFDVIVDNGRPSYIIKHPESGAEFGSDSNNTPFTTIDEAAAFAAKLGVLPKDQFQDQITIYKGVKGYKEK